jgi:hypothetical protein
MKNTSFEIKLDPNQTEFPRGKRAELNVYDDYTGFDCQYVINKLHKEGNITVIDDFTITSISIVGDDK